MSKEWDERERKDDKEQSVYYPDLAPKVKLKTDSTPWSPSPGDFRNFPTWQRWGFPAGLTLGILIGVFLGFLTVWLIVWLFRVAP